MQPASKTKYMVVTFMLLISTWYSVGNRTEREYPPGEWGGGAHISTTPWPSLTETAPLVRPLNAPRSANTHMQACTEPVTEWHTVAQKQLLTWRLRVRDCIWVLAAWLDLVSVTWGLTSVWAFTLTCFYPKPAAKISLPVSLRTRRPSGN